MFAEKATASASSLVLEKTDHVDAKFKTDKTLVTETDFDIENQIRNLINGTAKRIIKEGHVFNRIHVADIARIIYMLSVSDLKSDIFNVSDDMPAPPQDVVEFASGLLEIDPPEAVKFSEANLTEMARSFYSETKYIRNEKIKDKLKLQLKYPNYKIGLRDILKYEIRS